MRHLFKRFGKAVPLLLWLLAASAAHALPPAEGSDLARCYSRTPETAIAGCTAMIKDSNVTTISVAIAYNNRGVAYGRINRYDLAIGDFSQAIALRSNFVEASGEGAQQWAQDVVDRTAQWSDSYIANMSVQGSDSSTSVPDTALFYKNRGVAYYRTGKYANAVQDFTQALALRRNYLEALLDRGIAHVDANQYDDAIEDYNAAMEMKPTDSAPYVDRGALNARRENYDQAMADYTRAIALRPDDAFAYGGRCLVQAIQGKLQPALADCNAALDISPVLASALEARGFAELKLGQYEPARADYAAAVKSSADPEALYGRGIAEQMLGDGDHAEADIASAEKADAKVADEFARWGISAMRQSTPSSQENKNEGQIGPR